MRVYVIFSFSCTDTTHIGFGLTPMTSFTLCAKLLQLCLTGTPWTVALQEPLSMGFSRQGYWSGLSFPPPGVLPDPGIELRSPALQADDLPSEL